MAFHCNWHQLFWLVFTLPLPHVTQECPSLMTPTSLAFVHFLSKLVLHVSLHKLIPLASLQILPWLASSQNLSLSFKCHLHGVLPWLPYPEQVVRHVLLASIWILVSFFVAFLAFANGLFILKFRLQGHLASSVGKACNSWSRGHELKPTLGMEPTLNE